MSLRVVAATNQDLNKIRGVRLREDLYHRLAVFQVSIPPLAQRREDIANLVEGFVKHFASRVKKRVGGVTPAALAALKSYNYPGNVRELRNIVERAIILANGPDITERDLVLPERAPRPHEADAFFFVSLGDNGQPPLAEHVERAYVARVLEHFQGKRMVAAQALGISYPTFLKRLRELGFESE